MKTIIQQGKTVDEAIQLGLKELKASKEQVEVEVIEEGNKGILGFLSRDAKVKLTLKQNPIQKVENFLQGLVERIDVNSIFHVTSDKDVIKVDFQGADVGIIIGKHGKTLDAIQFLTSLAVNKGNDDFKRIIIDAENYRARREKSLTRFARNMAQKVKNTKRNIVLEPMLPNERRIVHTALQNDSTVYTKSIGEGPNRRVVISLK